MISIPLYYDIFTTIYVPTTIGFLLYRPPATDLFCFMISTAVDSFQGRHYMTLRHHAAVYSFPTVAGEAEVPSTAGPTDE
jgi:hypothetical protein